MCELLHDSVGDLRYTQHVNGRVSCLFNVQLKVPDHFHSGVVHAFHTSIPCFLLYLSLHQAPLQLLHQFATSWQLETPQ
jgi:hypothetical protein